MIEAIDDMNLILETEDMFIFPSMVNKSLLSIGPIQWSSRKECLYVVTLGGSITCGHGDPGTGGAGGDKRFAWPMTLEKLLNKHIPCQSAETGNKHVVNNICAGGVASDYWVERLVEWKQKETEIFTKADIIFVDTATNDIFDIPEPNVPWGGDLWLKRGKEFQKGADKDSEVFKRIKGLTEQIILLTRTQYRKSPDVVYLELSWNNVIEIAKLLENYNGPKSAVNQQLEVATYYGIPYISVVKAIAEDLAFHDFLKTYRVGDCCHLTKAGSVLAANIIFRGLLALSNMTGINGADANSKLANKNIQVAQFSTQNDLNLVLNTNPLVIATRCDETDKMFLVQCSGWSYKTESNGKEGLITFDPKAMLVYKLNEENINAHLKKGIIHLEGLKSYDHMGAVCVKVTSNGTQIAEFFVDYLWSQKISETFVDKFDFSDSLSKYTQSIAPATMKELEISISVCSSQKATRKEHKIKLFRITIF